MQYDTRGIYDEQMKQLPQRRTPLTAATRGGVDDAPRATRAHTGFVFLSRHRAGAIDRARARA
jgi:hypothetical protein